MFGGQSEPKEPTADTLAVSRAHHFAFANPPFFCSPYFPLLLMIAFQLFRNNQTRISSSLPLLHAFPLNHRRLGVCSLDPILIFLFQSVFLNTPQAKGLIAPVSIRFSVRSSGGYNSLNLVAHVALRSELESAEGFGEVHIVCHQGPQDGRSPGDPLVFRDP